MITPAKKEITIILLIIGSVYFIMWKYYQLDLTVAIVFSFIILLWSIKYISIKDREYYKKIGMEDGNREIK